MNVPIADAQYRLFSVSSRRVNREWSDAQGTQENPQPIPTAVISSLAAVISPDPQTVEWFHTMCPLLNASTVITAITAPSTRTATSRTCGSRRSQAFR